MKLMTKLILIPLILIAISYTSDAQGCSDAGLCSFDLSDDSTKSETHRFTLGLSNTIGIGDEAVIINSTGVELGANISDFGIIAKIPFTFTSGTLGQTNGLGDFTLLLSSKLYSEEEFGLSLATGVKLATNNSDLRNEDKLSLPMVYQTSGGTNDVLFLLAANFEDWIVSTGVQIPLNRNENTFEDNSEIIDLDPNAPDYYSEWQNYESSRNFKRGSDVMLKVEKYFTLQDDLKLMAGVLPVYRLEESSYQNTNGDDITIMGSDGLTLNIIAGLDYQITTKHTFGLNIGFPVLTREVRADGLTRALVASVDFKFEL